MAVYRATLEFIMSAPSDWTISQVAQYAAEQAESLSGTMKTNANGIVLIDSIKVAGEGD